ncbi:MAG: OmpA family protein [Thermoguttaceae bacterium]|nr:OmpA family protein [Thermoguttaceae bacterium]MDW8077526.1 OmpA family protein [Thermoguttaceae bacterium]
MRKLCPFILAVVFVGVSGCAGNSLLVKSQLEQAQQQQVALGRQNQELQTRVAALDQDNKRLQSLLAQSQQRAEVLEQQLALVREQLASVTAQLARVQQEKEAAEQKSQALTASLQRQPVTFSPNSSLLSTLPQFSDPDLQVRRDGDVIRIAIPAERLFDGETAVVRPDGLSLLAQVASELARLYPRQRIAIEGHVDAEAPQTHLWRNPMHLSTAWAIAVYEAVLQQKILRSEQLFLVSHGQHHPLATIGGEAARRLNRRIELVIYPETVN